MVEFEFLSGDGGTLLLLPEIKELRLPAGEASPEIYFTAASGPLAANQVTAAKMTP